MFEDDLFDIINDPLDHPMETAYMMEIMDEMDDEEKPSSSSRISNPAPRSEPKAEKDDSFLSRNALWVGVALGIILYLLLYVIFPAVFL